MPTTQHIADQIQDQKARTLLHGDGQAFIAEPGNKGGELAGNGNHGVSPQLGVQLSTSSAPANMGLGKGLPCPAPHGT
jgi:hypothetical protein